MGKAKKRMWEPAPDLLEDLLGAKREAYHFVGHTPQKVRGIPWPVCSGCGLVYLKNRPTEKAI